MNLLYGSSKQGTQALFWANNQRLLRFWALFVPINPQYLCHKVAPGNEGLLPPALSNSAGISDWSKPAHHGDPTPEPTLKFFWESWGHCGRARGGLKMSMPCPSQCFLLHSITLDWSIGLIPEFRFHLTNSLRSRLDQSPKKLSETFYFSPRKSRFSELGKRAKLVELGRAESY